MPELRTLLTPDLGPSAASPDPAVAGGVNLARADALRGQGAALAALAAQAAQTSQRQSSARKQNISSFLAIDLAAFEVQRKSQAQSLTVDTALRIDEKLQALLQDPSVNPLQLAQEGERVINEETNKALRASGGFNEDLKTFVQTKLDGIKLNKIPALRREGYKREGEAQVAATSRRNFNRKAELYATGTSEARKLELIEDSVADIESLAGVHISQARAEDLIQGEITDFKKNNLLALAVDDPLSALAILPEMRLTPREELAMENQIKNIIAIEENQRRATEAREAKLKKLESEKIVTDIYGKMIFNEADPRRLLADPAVRENISSGQLSGMIRFHETLAKVAEKEDNEDTSDIIRLTAQYGDGRMSPSQAAADLASELSNGAKLSRDDAEGLMKLALASYQRERSIFRTDFKDEWDAGEAGIKRLLKFEPGFLGIFDKERKTELTLALNTALKTYRSRMSDLRALGEERQVNPLTLARPSDIADEVLVDALPLAINALRSQKVSSNAFKDLISPGSLGRSRRELSKDLATQIQNGLISADEAAIVRNALTLSTEFENLQERMDMVDKAARLKKQRDEDARNKKGTSILDRINPFSSQ